MKIMISAYRSTRMVFIFQPNTLLLCMIVCLSSPQENNAQALDKSIDSTTTVVCTGCGDGNSCFINVNNVTVDEDNYVISDNGSVTVPANDLTVYGIMRCGGSIEQLMSYQICPPKNGIYNWINIISSENTITVGELVDILATFFHLPHSGITIMVNGSVSGDKDLSCSTNSWVRNTTVNYTCTAKQPGVKKVTMQLTFCDIDFRSSILIFIKEPAAPVNQSTSTNTPMTDGTSSSMMTSSMMSSNTIMSSNLSTPMPTANGSSFSSTAQTIASSSSSSSSVAMETNRPTDSKEDSESDQLSEGGTAAIAISVVILLIVMIFTIAGIVICIYIKRSTGATPSINIFINTIWCNLTGNGDVPTGNDDRHTRNGDVPIGNGNVHAGNDDIPAEDGDIPADDGDIPAGDDDIPAGDDDIPAGDDGNNLIGEINYPHPVEGEDDDVPEMQDGYVQQRVNTAPFMECSSSGHNIQLASLALHNQ